MKKKLVILLFGIVFFMVSCDSSKFAFKKGVYVSKRYAFNTYLYIHNDSMFTIAEGFVINYGQFLTKQDSLHLKLQENNLDTFYCDFNIWPIKDDIISMKILSKTKIKWKRSINETEDVFLFKRIGESELNKLDKIECNGHELIR